jgi:hypothetical protein
MITAGVARHRHSSVTPHIARPPVSLSKMLVKDPMAERPQGYGRHGGSVLYRSENNQYFKTDVRMYPAREFLAQLLQHLRDARTHLVRRYA